MEVQITKADLDVIGRRFKGTIRKGKSNAGQVESALGITKGSLGKIYKGKYPLARDLLHRFADHFETDPETLVTGTGYAIRFGFENAPEPVRAPQVEPSTPARTESSTTGAQHADSLLPDSVLESVPPSVVPLAERAVKPGQLPFHEQKTFSDELHVDEDAHLKKTDEGAWLREAGPRELAELEYAIAETETPQATRNPVPSVEPQKPPPVDEAETSLLGSLTSRLKGFFG